MTYSIMPMAYEAYGWTNNALAEYLWVNAAFDQTPGNDLPFSLELKKDLTEWFYEMNDGEFDRVSKCLILDWDRLHAKGLKLAIRLKSELGDSARVYYVKPIEDPNTYLHGHIEVLKDGSLLESPLSRPQYLEQCDWLPKMILSGGQTGVDRAALDWACRKRIPHGGWCPKGRTATDGPISQKYQLKETESAGYRQRTKLNVQDSCATLIFNTGALDGGTLQTARFARSMKKPVHILQLDQAGPQVAAAQQITQWLRQGTFQTLNIAGPREEKRPGIYAMVHEILDQCLPAVTPVRG